MDPRTPTCPSCHDKFPGRHCKKCGFEEGGISTIADRAAARRSAKARGWQTRSFAATATAGGTPRITRKRRKHGIPVR